MPPSWSWTGTPTRWWDESGKLWWIQDAYTTTDRYPYSANLAGRFNYIRNSVKVVVDAYNGTVDFYALDPEDSLLRMYSKAFPGLFRDFDEMPAALRGHVRYPIGLFSAQANMYLRYHVTDPQVFFNQAQQWAIPLETRFGKQGVRRYTLLHGVEKPWGGKGKNSF